MVLGLDQHPHLLSKLCPSDSEDSDKPSAEPARNLPGTPDSASPIICKDKKALFMHFSSTGQRDIQAGPQLGACLPPEILEQET